MDAGKLDERITLLRLGEIPEGYAWEPGPSLPVRAQRSGRTNLFSRVGLGEKSVTFTLRRRALTLDNALLWRGHHCFLTDIKEVDRQYLEVEAALVRPQTCIRWEWETVSDETNRLRKKGSPQSFSFPGILTEKYIRYEPGVPMMQIEHLLVLVTPKAVELKPGELVEIDGQKYAVRVCHRLDGYKNEYEIGVRGDNRIWPEAGLTPGI